jgi:hypothetical protein
MERAGVKEPWLGGSLALPQRAKWPQYPRLTLGRLAVTIGARTANEVTNYDSNDRNGMCS